MRHFLIITSLIFICVTGYSQPANDAPCSAIPLTVGAGCINGDNTLSTTEGLSLPGLI